MRNFGMSWIVGALALGALACDDGAADTAENAGRCQRICNAVAECAKDEDADTECRMTCKDESKDEIYEAKAVVCSRCVDRDNSCSENAIKCSSECAGVANLATTN